MENLPLNKCNLYADSLRFWIVRLVLCYFLSDVMIQFFIFIFCVCAFQSILGLSDFKEP